MTVMEKTMITMIISLLHGVHDIPTITSSDYTVKVLVTYVCCSACWLRVKAVVWCDYIVTNCCGIHHLFIYVFRLYFVSSFHSFF